MYLILKHGHWLTAALTALLTLIWLPLAWGGRGGVLAGPLKVGYIAHRAVAGLAALSGLALTFMGPWHALIFPYLGFAAFLIHEVAAAASRRRFGIAEQAGQRRAALVVQLLALGLIVYVMEVKPF